MFDPCNLQPPLTVFPDQLPMNWWLSHFIEIGMYGFAAWVAVHAYKQGRRWLSTLLWGMVFGTITEMLITWSHTQPSDTYYVYGKFLLNPNLTSDDFRSVPLWVGVGWGCIVYAATWTAQRLELPRWMRPLAAGVLAVNIDFALDPVANHFHFWKWHNVEPGSYYGVPFDNYIGWFFIVAAYTAFVPMFFRLYDKLTRSKERPEAEHYEPTNGAEFVVPPLAALTASGLLYAGRRWIWHLYMHVPASTFFHYLFLASAIFMVVFACKASRDNPVNWSVFLIPMAFHTFSAIALCLDSAFTLSKTEPQLDPSLLVAVLSHFLFAIFAYSWPSLERLFPLPDRKKPAKYLNGPPPQRPSASKHTARPNPSPAKEEQEAA
ncbi:MAG TPA: carotenoid biosynthesis protein [Polyangiaceae bacterium]|nr:carotenoid biosynthesis protein [Polyangiaceae bacterium]